MKKLVRIAVLAFAACVVMLCAGCAKGVADGTYLVQADTDSSMFRVEKCLLTVEDGQMTAQVSLPGQGFSRLYFGSVENAEAVASGSSVAGANDPNSGTIYDYYLNDDGLYTFDVPVPALDQKIQVAAFGHRRDTWYPHTIVFHAPSESDRVDDAEVAAAETPDDAVDSGLDDTVEEHTVAVELEGGTGRATVESPATIEAESDGTYVVTIVWSSPNYDQMIVGGEQYLPVNAEGNSMFEIPVQTLDEPLSVQAETTAMSEPHMIDYVLHFDPESLS